MNEKIESIHLERTGFVYIRQSSPYQMRHNLESQRRQYGFVDKARDLGFQRVVVIDDDLGRSGSGTVERPGFDRLVASVCRGEAGAIFAIEASRLARNNRDWHHLIDLCSLTRTLVIDFDGIYDPRLMNDRLLLGLKGAMSEFELGLFKQRGQEGLRQKVKRGEVFFEVPVGFIRTEDQRIELTPDRQVQKAIRGVFAKFRELGSARQVLLWYRDQGLSLPQCQPATWGKQIVWRIPIYSRIIAMLKNPVYAGAFVYGRRKTKTVIIDGKARKTQGHEVPREEWDVFIENHHEGYITWEDFLRNEKQMKENSNMRGQMSRGASKAGTAMLAGLLRCARCGRKLHVYYCGPKGRVPRYSCKGGHINHGVGRCISFGGLRVDQAVVAQVLDTIQPALVEATLEAQKEIDQQGQEKRQALQLALEKARYEVNYARRQYEAVDPDNRLVASELEKRWESALQHQKELETKLDKAICEQEKVSDEERNRLLELGSDLRQLWNHPQAPAALKKRILRTVLEEIVADVSQEDSQIILLLHWVGGTHTELRVAKNRTGQHRHCTDRQVVELVQELAKVCDDQAITAILNRLGYRTGAGNTWTETRVRHLRSYHGIPALDSTAEKQWLTLEGTANTLNVSPSTIRRLIQKGILPAQQVIEHAPWIIDRQDLDRTEIRRAIQAIHEGRKVPRTLSEEDQYPLFTGE